MTKCRTIVADPPWVHVEAIREALLHTDPTDYAAMKEAAIRLERLTHAIALLADMAEALASRVPKDANVQHPTRVLLARFDVLCGDDRV